MEFQLTHTDGAARCGLLRTPHGDVETPVFMPVGTQATVKGLTPHMVAEAGAQIILGNTYHLTLRPGDELIAQLGGLHGFMHWSGPILTDSGGFQIYSLAQGRKIDDRAAVFRSHIDGSLLELTPEKAVAIQENLGSDIAMCLDECPPLGTGDGPEGKHRRPPDDGSLRQAVRRTILWAERCKAAQRRADQSLFAIVQGGLDVSLRAECARSLVALDFPGYALGGFSVGETPQQMAAVLGDCAALLPATKPRYLMGVGRPEDILHAIGCGLDMFDCVLPTRNGRNAQALTYAGPIRLRNACHKRDSAPLESDCRCYTCRHFSRAYLHHLFQAEEMLGPTLASLHNVAFYCRLTADARQAIREGRFAQFRSVCLARWGSAV
ncbi:MAG: tRNA guanosine(34) transglycosylase Tgt [Planctomycetia bacterium]|nr:tRNA guanosine(34) transglycosylase Tgt [Planctomycetia bacterium]